MNLNLNNSETIPFYIPCEHQHYQTQPKDLGIILTSNLNRTIQYTQKKHIGRIDYVGSIYHKNC